MDAPRVGGQTRGGGISGAADSTLSTESGSGRFAGSASVGSARAWSGSNAVVAAHEVIEAHAPGAAGTQGTRHDLLELRVLQLLSACAPFIECDTAIRVGAEPLSIEHGARLPNSESCRKSAYEMVAISR